jgi:hypothetical protein
MVGFLWYLAEPSGKNFSNLKTCDIINPGASSEPVITDSLSQPLMLSESLLVSALKMFGQISVAAD